MKIITHFIVNKMKDINECVLKFDDSKSNVVYAFEAKRKRNRIIYTLYSMGNNTKKKSHTLGIKKAYCKYMYVYMYINMYT